MVRPKGMFEEYREGIELVLGQVLQTESATRTNQGILSISDAFKSTTFVYIVF
jgi:hypothetical protein